VVALQNIENNEVACKIFLGKELGELCCHARTPIHSFTGHVHGETVIRKIFSLNGLRSGSQNHGICGSAFLWQKLSEVIHFVLFRL
jgi:hypothetical protein